jgi:hypothetical protein
MIELITCVCIGVLIVMNAGGIVMVSIILSNMKIMINQMSHFIDHEKYSTSNDGDLAHRLAELQKMRFSPIRSQQPRIKK